MRKREKRKVFKEALHLPQSNKITTKDLGGKLSSNYSPGTVHGFEPSDGEPNEG
jgi:hypothetical protein